jgi:hypothetical protein
MSDSRTTSVGPLAMRRFLRPVCYQDLLPEALRDENAPDLPRLPDGACRPSALSCGPCSPSCQYVVHDSSRRLGEWIGTMARRRSRPNREDIRWS